MMNPSTSINPSSTFRQVIQFYYYLIFLKPTADIIDVTEKIKNNLKSIWAAVNPNLLLMTDKSISRKVKGTLILMKNTESMVEQVANKI